MLQWEGVPGLHAAVACTDFTSSKKPGLGNIKPILLSFCRLMLVVIATTNVVRKSAESTPFIDSATFLYQSSALLATLD